MRRFKSTAQAQRFLTVHAAVYNLFNLGRHLVGAAQLPPGQREALTLRFVDGLSLGEIAEALDIPEDTVKSRLHGGIANLRASPCLKIFSIE